MITPRTTDSDGAEATASRHITILPLSPGNRISRLQLETLDAYDFRRGTNGEMQSLLNLLTTAREQIPRGNVRAAINQLEAYIHRSGGSPGTSIQRSRWKPHCRRSTRRTQSFSGRLTWGGTPRTRHGLAAVAAWRLHGRFTRGGPPCITALAGAWRLTARIDG